MFILIPLSCHWPTFKSKSVCITLEELPTPTCSFLPKLHLHTLSNWLCHSWLYPKSPWGKLSPLLVFSLRVPLFLKCPLSIWCSPGHFSHHVWMWRVNVYNLGKVPSQRSVTSSIQVFLIPVFLTTKYFHFFLFSFSRCQSMMSYRISAQISLIFNSIGKPQLNINKATLLRKTQSNDHLLDHSIGYNIEFRSKNILGQIQRNENLSPVRYQSKVTEPETNHLRNQIS